MSSTPTEKNEKKQMAETFSAADLYILEKKAQYSPETLLKPILSAESLPDEAAKRHLFEMFLRDVKQETDAAIEKELRKDRQYSWCSWKDKLGWSLADYGVATRRLNLFDGYRPILASCMSLDARTNAAGLTIAQLAVCCASLEAYSTSLNRRAFGPKPPPKISRDLGGVMCSMVSSVTVETPSQDPVVNSVLFAFADRGWLQPSTQLIISLPVLPEDKEFANVKLNPLALAVFLNETTALRICLAQGPQFLLQMDARMGSVYFLAILANSFEAFKMLVAHEKAEAAKTYRNGCVFEMPNGSGMHVLQYAQSWKRQTFIDYIAAEIPQLVDRQPKQQLGIALPKK